MRREDYHENIQDKKEKATTRPQTASHNWSGAVSVTEGPVERGDDHTHWRSCPDSRFREADRADHVGGLASNSQGNRRQQCRNRRLGSRLITTPAISIRAAAHYGSRFFVGRTHYVAIKTSLQKILFPSDNLQPLSRTYARPCSENNLHPQVFKKTLQFFHIEITKNL